MADGHVDLILPFQPTQCMDPFEERGDFSDLVLCRRQMQINELPPVRVDDVAAVMNDHINIVMFCKFKRHVRCHPFSAAFV